MLRFAFFLTFFFFSLGYAEEEKFQLSQYTYEAIAQVQELIDTNQNLHAEQKLRELTKAPEVQQNLDKAYVRFYFGYFYTVQNQPQKAIKYFKEALSYDALAKQQRLNAYLNITQLSVMQENHKEAFVFVEKLLQEEQKAQYYIAKAQIALSLEKYALVVEAIDNARALQEPKKEWLQMQFYAYYMLQNYTDAQKILKELLYLQPFEKEYWLQLASLYGLQEEYPYALASLEIASFAKLRLNEQEVLQLISLLRSANIPFYAAELMEYYFQKDLLKPQRKNYELLAELYFEAKMYQKSLEWYKKIIHEDPDGMIAYKVARIYILDHKYQKAVEILESSLEKSLEKSVEERYGLLGKTYYEIKEYGKACEVFQKLLKYPKTKETAQAWLGYLSNYL